MRISTSKSVALVLSRKLIDCPLQAGNKSLPQVKEFKCFKVLFTINRTLEHEVHWRIRIAGKILESFYCTIIGMNTGL